MDETLYQISRNLVSSILSILEIQEKITRITKEALDASGKNKRITAIETRRILDYISRTLSNNILLVIRDSTESELHHLVYGFAQIATETSIISALKDTTFATALSKKQAIDLSLRKKRSVKKESLDISNKVTTQVPSLYNVILNKSDEILTNKTNTVAVLTGIPIPDSPYSVINRGKSKSIEILHGKGSYEISQKGFLNKTSLDMENEEIKQINSMNTSTSIILDNKLNSSKTGPVSLDVIEASAPVLLDDWADHGDGIRKEMHSDIAAEMELDQDEISDELKNQKRAKLKLERLEAKAKKAILYSGDVAYLAAASLVAMRRALTASNEVQMSVMLAKTGMSNHQDLMMNLAKTAAQQVGKEAKIATSKSLSCERMLKLALKYTSQSHGAVLNHVANRVVMSTFSLSTLAKSMAYVSSDIAINSLYMATDVKPPA